MAVAMGMVLRASSASAPSLLVSSSHRFLSNPYPKSDLKLPSSATLSLFSLFTAPLEAKAFSIPKDQIVSSLTQVEETIDQVQEVGSGFLAASQQVLGAIAETLKPDVDAALPFLQQAGEEAIKVASPAISEATKIVQEAIQSAGIDTEPVTKSVTNAAQQTTRVIEVAKPIASSMVETISSSDPIVIIEATAALFLVYILLPPIWSDVTISFRGYRGGLTPAQTLDLLCTQSHFLIDIRSEKDKNKAGIPRLPPSAKNRVIAIPIEELPSKLRGLVRNSRDAEAEIAALKISYLKRIDKGSNIVIMDSYADSAKIVAKTLTSLGFKNCWVMTDGFSGSKGWLQSLLGTESYNLSFSEILAPSRIIPAGVRRLGTGSSRVQSS
ncbi:hypothetical protein Dimus_024037 [Dionaea muscipula]